MCISWPVYVLILSYEAVIMCMQVPALLLCFQISNRDCSVWDRYMHIRKFWFQRQLTTNCQYTTGIWVFGITLTVYSPTTFRYEAK